MIQAKARPKKKNDASVAQPCTNVYMTDECVADEAEPVLADIAALAKICAADKSAPSHGKVMETLNYWKAFFVVVDRLLFVVLSVVFYCALFCVVIVGSCFSLCLLLWLLLCCRCLLFVV